MRRLTCLLLCCLMVLSLTACGAPKTEALDIFAMDTYVSLVAIGDGASDVLQKCSTQINTLEQKLSRTIATSDVSRLNADGTAQLDEDCLATALPHFTITPRGVEGDAAQLILALHRIDGQLALGGRRRAGGRIQRHIENARRHRQRTQYRQHPPVQQEYPHPFLFHIDPRPFWCPAYACRRGKIPEHGSIEGRVTITFLHYASPENNSCASSCRSLLTSMAISLSEQSRSPRNHCL